MYIRISTVCKVHINRTESACIHEYSYPTRKFFPNNVLSRATRVTCLVFFDRWNTIFSPFIVYHRRLLSTTVFVHLALSTNSCYIYRKVFRHRHRTSGLTRVSLRMNILNVNTFIYLL